MRGFLFGTSVYIHVSVHTCVDTHSCTARCRCCWAKITAQAGIRPHGVEG